MFQGQTMGRGSRTARHNNGDVRARHKQSHHLHPVLKNSSVFVFLQTCGHQYFSHPEVTNQMQHQMQQARNTWRQHENLQVKKNRIHSMTKTINENSFRSSLIVTGTVGGNLYHSFFGTL